MLRDQGTNLLLNYYFGPIVNAAKGIANQVNGALQSFASNVLVPARPQIVQSYARHEYQRTFRLMISTSKLSCLVFCMMSLPVCFQINLILKLWLGDSIPDYTRSFIIIMLITNTWGSLIAPISAVIHATGQMKYYQIFSSISNLFSVPLALLFLILKKDPNIVFCALFLTMVSNQLVGLISLKKLTNFSLKYYYSKLLLPLSIVIFMSTLVISILHMLINNQVLNFVVDVLASVLLISCLAYFICLDNREKQFVNSTLIRLFRLR